jgi:hypothetical protein
MIRITTLAAIALAGSYCSTAMADYGQRAAFAPGWESETGYTVQDWGLHAVDEAEPAQPLTADNGYTNPYGTPTTVWQTQTPQGFFGWSQTPMGTHPAWVDETWGGMMQMGGGTGTLTATVDPGDEDGPLKVWVEYDWYNYPDALVDASIAGATDITPATYDNYKLADGTSGPWYRTVKVFEFAENPDVAFDVVFTGTGFATVLDSFEISTAVGSGVVVPAEMPAVPEPGTWLLLASGIVGVLACRRRRERGSPRANSSPFGV